jgi:catechol 2,3-dioxygenase-like lactoylglutathione lyase family enzyme
MRTTAKLAIATLLTGVAMTFFTPAPVFAQGRCMLTAGSPACNTADIVPVFAATGWKTIALERITFKVADAPKEAAFYGALMGWTPQAGDDQQITMGVGDWGTVVFQGGGGPRAEVTSFCFAVDKWNAKTVEAELRKRGLDPVADNDGKGFESFHVKDPDGFDLQISNGFIAKMRRRAAPSASSPSPAPFASTGWKTVWLDHFSYNVSNYKASASFYQNLLGWTPTYDEGSQNEMLIGDIGDIIIRGGNPLDPNFKAGARAARIDHISFGIVPWDTDGVKAELEKRGLRAQIDTSSKHQDASGAWVPDDIHTAAFKSYHTQTPNGYNLQISYVTRELRLMLSNAVRPKTPGVK